MLKHPLNYFFAGIIAGLALVVGGCQGAKTPETFPVTGLVQYKDGQLLREGLVRFSSIQDPLLIATGNVEKDGTFTLSTLTSDGKRIPGAVEGDHRITIELPQGADQSFSQIQQSIQEAKVTPEKNHFVIEIEKVQPSNVE
jgi:hypothetical protein